MGVPRAGTAPVVPVVAEYWADLARRLSNVLQSASSVLRCKHPFLVLSVPASLTLALVAGGPVCLAPLTLATATTQFIRPKDLSKCNCCNQLHYGGTHV